MRFAIVSYGLRDVVEEVLKDYDAEVFDSLEDLEEGEYDFILFASELGDERGDKLIEDLKSVKSKFLIFCVNPTSIKGIQKSRYQAYEIATMDNFEGAIVSGFLNFEEKVEALKMVLESYLASK